MDWNKKAQALNLIGELTLKPSQVIPDGWMASLGLIEVGGDGFLTGLSSHRETPEEAVLDLWDEATTLPKDKFLVRHAMSDKHRKCFRWDQFMWIEVKERPQELEAMEAV